MTETTREGTSMRLVLLGPPGAGKGTQAAAIAGAYRIPHISTGDIFRDNARRQTPLGLQAASFMDRGALVPDEVVIRMVMDRIDQQDAAHGFLLDGFPRTVPQAIALEDALAEEARPLDAVLRFVVDDEEAIARLVRRGAIEGRSDDTEDVIRRRLEEYHAKTEPLEAFYAERGQLRDVEAVGPVEEITRRALEALGVLGSRPEGGAR
jgi:adenylate kinase